MATLQKIRNHGTLLLIIVGVAMLAFILGDFLNSGSSFFNRSKENIGEIAGHKIHYTEYNAAEEQLVDWYKVQFNTNSPSDEVMGQIRQQVWMDLKAEWLLTPQMEEIGMHVTDEELDAMFQGQNLHPWIMNSPLFKDENGQFSMDIYETNKDWLEQNLADDEQNEQSKLILNHWQYIKKRVRLDRMQVKYTQLVQSMLAYSDLDAKYACTTDEYSVDAQYIKVPYTKIADDQINIKKSDLKKMYNKRKKLYKQTPNCTLEYVVFPINPSEEDFAAMEQNMLKDKEAFLTSEDVADVINYTSLVKYYAQNYSKETVPAAYQDFAFAAGVKKGDFMDLTRDGDIYRMARIMDCGYTMPDSVQLRAVVTGREDLTAEWVKISDMSEEWVKAVMDAKLNEPFVSPRGDTLVCLERSAATPKAKVAIYECQVTASTKTHSNVYNKAKQFIFASGNANQFYENAKKEGLIIKPEQFDRNAQGIGDIKQSRPIVKWAFDAEAGDISDVFEYNDQCVVALVKEVSTGDYKTMEEVENELNQLIIREKKANCISAILKNLNSLEQVAQVMGDSIQTATGIMLNSAHFGAEAYEPAAVGAAFATAEGKLSAPIAGESGVFVMIPGKKQMVNENALDSAVISQKFNNLNMSLQYMVNQDVILNALENQTEIEDNRFNFQ